jgi:thiol-disulfide isomerase/thioredoxin
MTTPAPSARNRIWKVLAPVGAILVLVVGGLYAVKSQVAKQGGPHGGEATQTGGNAEGQAQMVVGATLPDFRLERFGTTGDAKFIQASQLKSKVTLINFWATWCEACMVEMPSIAKLWDGYKAKGFDVVAVNVDQNPDAVLPRTIQRLKLDFPVYVDKESKLADLFQIQAIPLSVVIDQNRKILMIENGERDWDGTDVHAELEKWLAGT